MKRKHDKGFTLIEVMIALAIVAIVSTPLLQMFVTTSFANHDAQVMDLANTIVIQQAETFKADPEGYRTSNGNVSYYFYNKDGTNIGQYPDLSIIPEGAAFRVKSATQVPIPSNPPDAGFYPDFAGTLNLPLVSSVFDVNINNTYDIDVEPSGSTFTYDRLKMTDKLIPIRVDFQGASKTINLTNDSDKEAEFYIFDTNDEDSNVVNINTIRGSSSVTYVYTSEKGSNNLYNLTLTVNRINKGVWVEMFNYSASANQHIID